MCRPAYYFASFEIYDASTTHAWFVGHWVGEVKHSVGCEIWGFGARRCFSLAQQCCRLIAREHSKEEDNESSVAYNNDNGLESETVFTRPLGVEIEENYESSVAYNVNRLESKIGVFTSPLKAHVVRQSIAVPYL